MEQGRTMRAAHWMVGIALALTASLAVAKREMPPLLEEVMIMRVEGDIVVDATGRVVSHRITTKLTDGLRARLDKAVPGWQFQPVAPPDGANEVRRAMALTLAATKVDAGHVVRLEDAAFADAAGIIVRQRDRGRPSLPVRSFIRSPYEETAAIVEVAALVEDTGRAKEVANIRCTLLNAGGDAEEKALMCGRLEGLATEAAKLTRYKRGDLPLPGIVSIDMYFQPNGPIDESAGKWRIESRTVLRAVPWAPPAQPALPASTLSLRRGVIGATL
jgi:hypothetical protein